jgi:hypothetical protein
VLPIGEVLDPRIAAMTAAVTSRVVAFPPTSGMIIPAAQTSSMAFIYFTETLRH